MIQAIFFDVANTLLFKPALISNIQSAFKESGYNLSIQQIHAAHQKLTEEIIFPDATSKQFYEDFNAKLCEELNVTPSSQLISTIYHACKGLNWVAFEDSMLIESIPLPKGIGSNWDLTLREKLLEFFPFPFSWVLGSEEIGFKKPSTHFFHKMVEVSGYQANEIMFVGDSMRLDIKPAKEIGMDAVLIDRNNFYAHYDGKKVKSLNELITSL